MAPALADWNVPDRRAPGPTYVHVEKTCSTREFTGNRAGKTPDPDSQWGGLDDGLKG
jgi:hypothetical protein